MGNALKLNSYLYTALCPNEQLCFQAGTSEEEHEARAMEAIERFEKQFGAGD